MGYTPFAARFFVGKTLKSADPRKILMPAVDMIRKKKSEPIVMNICSKFTLRKQSTDSVSDFKKNCDDTEEACKKSSQSDSRIFRTNY